MALPLLDLDDRRWRDLTDEARARIAVHAPCWTDHNVHDPGITFLELLAWITEMDLYRINRIPDTHRATFLALAGFAPRPPAGARVVLGLELDPESPAFTFPAGTEIHPLTADRPVPFLTDAALTLVPGRIEALGYSAGTRTTDLGAAARRGETLEVLGPDPRPGTTFHVGLSHPLPVGVQVRFEIEVAGSRPEERRRLVEQAALEQAACSPPDVGIHCQDSHPCADSDNAASPKDAPAGGEGHDDGAANGPGLARLGHHSASLVWEAAVGPEVWQPLDAETGEVDDRSRALTLSGPVIVRLPQPMAPIDPGDGSPPRYWLRARLQSGRFDAPPRLRLIRLNGVPARQEQHVMSEWTLAPEAVVTGPVPSPGQETRLTFTLDAGGRIAAVHFNADAPRFFVLGWAAPASDKPGRLTLAAIRVGVGSGHPHQVFELPRAQVAGNTLALYTLEDGAWQTWSLRPGFEASGRSDAHYLMDAGTAEVQVGDGERGRVVPAGAPVIATYAATEGTGGNVPAGTLGMLADSVRNQALIPDYDTVRARVARIIQPVDATGGEDDEALTETAARALDDLETPGRAVTLADIEHLGRTTPGTRIARASAKALVHPAFPCIRAAGLVTVVVIPFLPAGRPAPSAGLRRLVAARLAAWRILGTRIEVAGPEYVKVTVRATVKACEFVDSAALGQRIRERLQTFFHPLHGGENGEGWPLGRDVYRSEVFQVLEGIEGVDHVQALRLVDDSGTAVCANLCLPPCGLVDGGNHEIEVAT